MASGRHRRAAERPLRSFELRRVFADAQPSAAISLAAHRGFSLAQELDALGEQIGTLSSGMVVDELGETREELRWPATESAEPLPRKWRR